MTSNKGFAKGLARMRHLQPPEHFARQDLQRAQRDCEILATKFQESPEDVLSLLEAVSQNDTARAKQIVSDLGMTEDDFKAGGGGIYALVFLIVLLWATEAY